MQLTWPALYISERTQSGLVIQGAILICLFLHRLFNLQIFTHTPCSVLCLGPLCVNIGINQYHQFDLKRVLYQLCFFFLAPGLLGLQILMVSASTHLLQQNRFSISFMHPCGKLHFSGHLHMIIFSKAKFY